MVRNTKKKNLKLKIIITCWLWLEDRLLRFRGKPIGEQTGGDWWELEDETGPEHGTGAIFEQDSVLPDTQGKLFFCAGEFNFMRVILSCWSRLFRLPSQTVLPLV